MRSRLALTLLLSAAVLACASAEGAYADGMALEQSGDLVGAADAYATALERDRSLPNVAGRLAVAGRGAVRQHLAAAEGLDAEGAALAYHRADALVVRAAAVGVDLERPAAFAADRDARYDAAVRSLTDAASRAAAPSDAVALTGRARAFPMTDAQAVALDRVARDAYAAWAEADLSAGRYRAALTHADDALSLGASARLADLRRRVLDLGALRVAVFPAEGDDDLFARDVSDVLYDEALVSNDPFLLFADPADVRSWARRSRGPALSASPRRLADAAIDLDADFGVVVLIRPLATREVRGEAETRTADLESGGRATYTVRELTVEIEAEADVLVVASGTWRSVCDRRVSRAARARVDLVSYPGDWRQLELSRGARRAFAPDAADRARADARDELRDRLAAAVAERIEGCVSAFVP
ncbi:hypothetical protein [Rubrivirga sp. IMCC45206]|uniref:hypothetical protein n=1 Tax=Rubrivirga sp. IMCC45206 TaxID=3391614 RepID=UPI00398F99E1